MHIFAADERATTAILNYFQQGIIIIIASLPDADVGKTIPLNLKDRTPKDVERIEIEVSILKVSQEMENDKPDLLSGKILATLFFEPSTWTRLSFESAMCRLGGKVIGFSDEKVSSVKRGNDLGYSQRKNRWI